MAKQNCEKCPFRARYDARPESLLGRIWRWHINWCPGWKRYTASLSPEQQAELAKRYRK